MVAAISGAFADIASHSASAWLLWVWDARARTAFIVGRPPGPKHLGEGGLVGIDQGRGLPVLLSQPVVREVQVDPDGLDRAVTGLGLRGFQGHARFPDWRVRHVWRSPWQVACSRPVRTGSAERTSSTPSGGLGTPRRDSFNTTRTLWVLKLWAARHGGTHRAR
jgi:hypothetical protein